MLSNQHEHVSLYIWIYGNQTKKKNEHRQTDRTSNDAHSVARGVNTTGVVLPRTTHTARTHTTHHTHTLHTVYTRTPHLPTHATYPHALSTRLHHRAAITPHLNINNRAPPPAYHSFSLACKRRTNHCHNRTGSMADGRRRPFLLYTGGGVFGVYPSHRQPVTSTYSS